MDETNKIDTAYVRGRWNVPGSTGARELYDINDLCDALDEARADVLMFAEANVELIACKNNLHERLNEEIARATRAEAKLARVEALVAPPDLSGNHETAGPLWSVYDAPAHRALDLILDALKDKK